MPELKKFPSEVFGYAYTDKSETAKDSINRQYCHYVGGECKKPRKSEPHIKTGICSVGYKGAFKNEYSPVIICPHRFMERVVFDTITKNYLKHWGKFPEWVSEVSIGVGGSVDYVAVLRDENGEVNDFLCVEFQAAGTTGSPWAAVLELKEHGHYLSDSYAYGINWANEFLKTMMQQVYKKGKIVSHWGRKIIFVVQDVAIEYIQSSVDASDLRLVTGPNDDEIHFVTFKMDWGGERWILSPSRVFSTDIEGIGRLLGGALPEHFPTVDEFMMSIQSKGNRDNVF